MGSEMCIRDRCLEARLKRLRFPAHQGESVSVVLPLGYRVTR